MSVAVSPVIPDAESAAAAAEALERVQAYLRAHPDGPATVRLADDDGGQLVVPRAAVELLSRILAHMANGHGVSVVPAYAELTTQQATDAMKERASAPRDSHPRATLGLFTSTTTREALWTSMTAGSLSG